MAPTIRKLALGVSVLLVCACSSGQAQPSPASSSPAPQSSATATPTPSPSASVAPPTIDGSATAQVTNIEVVVSGVDAPWSIEPVTGDEVLVTERDSGDILAVRSGQSIPLAGAGAEWIHDQLNNEGEGGLLGLAAHPTNPNLLYVYITRAHDNAVVRLLREGDQLSSADVVLDAIPRARVHNGGRLKFGPDGYLYVSTGDARDRPLSQDYGSLAGKILRIVADGSEQDGTAAPGNPQGSQVWSWGHRNVQGLGWVADGRMYASEFGNNTWDELNLIEAGHNYGWPLTEGYDGFSSTPEPNQIVDGVHSPVATWTTEEASPSGIAITNEAIYLAALRGEGIWRIPLTASGIGTPHRLLDGYGRIRDVAVSPDGRIYALTNNTDGRGTPSDQDDQLLLLTVEPDE